MADRDFGSAVTEIDVHRAHRRVFDAAAHMIKRMNERRDFAMHAHDFELGSSKEIDVAHHIFARHREGDGLDLRLTITTVLAYGGSAHDERRGITSQRNRDLSAHHHVGARGFLRRDTDMLHQHVLRERSQHHPRSSEIRLAQDGGQFFRDVLKPRIERL